VRNSSKLFCGSNVTEPANDARVSWHRCIRCDGCSVGFGMITDLASPFSPCISWPLLYRLSSQPSRTISGKLGMTPLRHGQCVSPKMRDDDQRAGSSLAAPTWLSWLTLAPPSPSLPSPENRGYPIDQASAATQTRNRQWLGRAGKEPGTPHLGCYNREP